MVDCEWKLRSWPCAAKAIRPKIAPQTAPKTTAPSTVPREPIGTKIAISRPNQAEPGAGAGAEQGGLAVAHPAAHDLHALEVVADDARGAHLEAGVGEQVDGGLGVAVVGEVGDRGHRRGGGEAGIAGVGGLGLLHVVAVQGLGA